MNEPRAVGARPRRRPFVDRIAEGLEGQCDLTAQELFRSAYPDPQMTTAEGFIRQYHDDVADLDDMRLEDERLLARLRRATDRRPTEGLLERIARLDTEAARRRAKPRR